MAGWGCLPWPAFFACIGCRRKLRGDQADVNRQKRSEAAWDSGTDAERSLGITLRRDGRPGRLWEGQRRPLQDPRLGKGRNVLAVVS